jgi:hypothetical protein
MRARNPRRPLCQREVRVGLRGRWKRVKQNQIDMMQLRRGCLQSMQISWCGCHLAARMGFRHPHVPALSSHFLATFPLGCRHRCIGQRTRHHRQCGEQYCQRENPDFSHGSQHNQSSSDNQLDATSEKTSQLLQSSAQNAFNS